MARKTVLAVDLGAESGRVMAVHFDGSQFELEELHRFSNSVVNVRGTLYWDVFHLWKNIQEGIEKGKAHHPASIGVDSWGVDFGLLDAQDNLLGSPVMYRDARTDGMMEAVFACVPRREVFEQTGNQFMQLNTLYQLMSLVRSQSAQLDAARTFLTIPSLFNYWLTGEKTCEFTHATTTQMFNPKSGTWAKSLLDQVGIPTHMLPGIVPPGTRLGTYEGIPVVAPATHDTGSAVAAVPTVTRNYAYISSGTWSLVGLEVPDALINDAVYSANLTNEGGVENTYRLLKNVVGMWILQQCRSTWAAEGSQYSYDELVQLATNSAPLQTIIDVDAPCFMAPGNYPQRIQDWCVEHGATVPETKGAAARAILESLALKYRDTVNMIQQISRQPIEVIHIVGGGSRNTLMNQFTADATGIPVVAGPVEATVLGNAILQLIALGELSSVAEARKLLSQSTEAKVYYPENTAVWHQAYERFQQLLV